jgi:metal-responsive CopG/Arc/MetJ family transcriptional regulator
MTTTSTRARKFSEGKRPVQVIFPEDILTVVDRAADRARLDRSAWIRQAALAYLPPDLYREIERP